MNGISRRSGSTLACALLTLVACGGEAPGTVEQHGMLGAGAPAYLALGDSVPFGLDPLAVPPPNENAFVGYPDHLRDLLDLPLANAACPGETTASFISVDAAATGLAARCALFKASGWLHAEYSGSQLDFATAFLQAHPRTRLVTVTIGANDLFDVQDACGPDLACLLGQLPAVAERIGTNLARAFGAIGDAGYTGRIVVPLYYVPDPADPVAAGAVGILNQTLAGVASAFGASTVDVRGAFERESGPEGDPCAAGLLIPLPGGGCDVHPSAAGARLIAREIAASLGTAPVAMGISTSPSAASR